MKICILLALLAASPVVHAGCKEMAAAIVDAEKDIAYQTARRQARIEAVDGPRASDQLAVIQINTMLMQTAKCPPRGEAVSADGAAYLSAAAKCVKPGRDAETCDRTKWVRE